MSDFFPDPPPPPEPVERPTPGWLGPPDDVLPGVVPVELVLGRSPRAVVMLSGMRAFPAGLAMTLHVRTRSGRHHDVLHEEVFDDAGDRHRDPVWRRDRLKWGFELADGRRATNLGPWPDLSAVDQDPDHPVLMGGGGGASDHSADRDYWLWPLPPPGPLVVVCEWVERGIERTVTQLDGDAIVAAAGRSAPVWPTKD